MFLGLVVVIVAGGVTLGVVPNVLAAHCPAGQEHGDSGGTSCIAIAAAAPATSVGSTNKPSAEKQTTLKGEGGVMDFADPDYWIALVARGLLYVAQLGIKITLFLFTFVIQISAYNGYLDATAVNVGWVMVRDMTNMLFVIVLLLIAFGTILGLEQYEWKKMLVKFVMAAVLVNFSRLICGILIDISQLVMTTFINGIVATAGGNLINAFGLQKIINLNSAAKPGELTSPGIFSAAVMAVVFSLMTVYTIGIFVFILAKRLITLWILIVLSPMAFVLTIIPSTEGAASKWWTEFMDNLVTGPVILFFIWLSFVTVGQGQINNEISNNAAEQIGTQYVIVEGGALEADKVGGAQTAGVGDAMGWNQMASFIIAIGMLIAGAEVASQIGGSSGSALSGVAEFGKKVGTIASGYAVGRWLYGKGGEAVGAVGGGLKAAAGFVALDVTGIRSKAGIVANYAKRQWDSYKSAAAFSMKEDGMMDEEVDAVDPKTGLVMKDAAGNAIKRKTGRQVIKWKKVEDSEKNFFTRRYGKRLLAEIESKKTLEKTEHELETRMAILDKSVKGVPKGWFQNDWETKDRDGFDRRQDAFLDGMGQRSSAKTEEHKAKALAGMMQSERIQYDPEKGDWVKKGGTYGQEIATHQLKAAEHNKILQRVQAQAKVDVMLKDQTGTGKYAGQLTDLMKQGALAQRETETADANLKRIQGEVSRAATTTAQGRDVLVARAAAEAGAHTEHGREEEILKRAERIFQKSAEGQHELLQDAEIARRMKHLEGLAAVEKGEAEKAATISQRRVIARTERAAIDTGLLSAQQKTMEETIKSEVMGAEQGKLGQTEAEKINLATQQEIIKALEAEVRQSLVADASGVSSPEYKAFLAAQARGGMIKNTLGSVEKVKANDAQKALVKKGQAAEDEARKKDTEAELMHSTDPLVVAALDSIKRSRERLSQMGIEIGAMEKAVKDAATEADKAVAQTALDQRRAVLNLESGVITTDIAAQRLIVTNREAVDTSLQAEKQRLKDEANVLRRNDVTRVYAAAKAHEEESNLALSAVHDQLLSDVEQQEVHKARGVQMPTKAMGKTSEAYARDFVGMDYKMFTGNIGSNILAMDKKREAAKLVQNDIDAALLLNPAADVSALREQLEKVDVTTADKAETAALIQHGVKKGWMDDGIWRVMDEDLKEKIQLKLGWQNTEFNIGKINDLMAVMTSGGDLDFAQEHHAIGKAMDFAEEKMKMSKEDFYTKLEDDTFTDEEQIMISQNIGGSAGLFNNRAKVLDYIKKVDENQAQLQLVTNMRDDAAASSHPENGGHGDYVTLKNGKKRYVLNGSRTARNAVYAEVNKLPPTLRAQQKSHATMNIDERSNYATKVREEDNRIVRSGLNTSNDHRGTDVRLENHSGGLSGMEDSSNFITANDGFLATGNDKYGNQSGRHAWAQTFYDFDDTTGEETNLRGGYDDIKEAYARAALPPAHINYAALPAHFNGMTEEQALLQKTSSDIVNNMFVPKIATSPRDWLITMAKLGQIDEQDALKEGKLNLSVRVHGVVRKPSDINELIGWYNAGAFTINGAPPDKQLQALNFT